MSRINIRVTQVLGCSRAYQYSLEKVKRLPPHFYSMRGTLLHKVLEGHFKREVGVEQYEECPSVESRVEQIVKFSNDFQKWKVDRESHLGRELISSFFDVSENMQKWFNETELDMSEENVLVVEGEMSMPVRGDYWLVGHADVITKTHILDFKSGKTYRNYNYMKQLGAYRDLAMYLGTHDFSVNGDFELMNVFFGDKDSFGKILHKQSEVDRLMPEFYSSFFRLVEEDRRWRENDGYMMPCWLSLKCAFCDWRHECRGR